MGEVVEASNVKLDIVKAVKDSFNLLKDNLGLLLVASLSQLGVVLAGAVVASVVVGMVFCLSFRVGPIFFCTLFFFFVFGIIFMPPSLMGMFYVSDRLVTGNAKETTAWTAFKGFSFRGPALLLLIFACLGYFACGVGVWITFPIATLGMLRVLDKGVSCIEAIKFGFNALFKQNQWMFIVLMIVASFLSGLGSFFFIIGILVTMPLYFLILVCGYRQIYPKT